MRLSIPALKLASIYLAILISVTLFYSAMIFSASSSSIEQGLRRPYSQRQNQYLGPDLRDIIREIDDANREAVIQKTKNELVRRLIVMNLFIWTVGGIAGYYFALKTLEPIEESARKLEQFTADAAHELRTPLSAMRLENELYLSDKKQTLKMSNELARSNIEGIDSLTRLSEDLLVLTRGDVNEVKAEIVIKDVLESVIDTLKPLAVSKNIDIEFKSSSKNTILANEADIRRLFMAILENAIKYTASNNKVRVELTSVKSVSKIVISDNGPGIDEDHLAKVFDRFYRADSSRTESGFGLGLSIAKEIVNKYQGTIGIKSQKGKGTKVIVTL